MSDYANILRHLNACKRAWSNQDYLNAAIDAYWCIQYCKYGEPYEISGEELHNSESQAWRFYQKASKKFKSSILSKTTYVYGTICSKLLWLYKNKHDLHRISEKAQNKFDAGHNIGNLAQKLFPGDIDASKFDSERIIDMSRISLPFNLKQQQWLDKTRDLYKDNTIYEAAFVYDDVFAAVDILARTDEGHVAYEVKSSSSITDTIIKDCALQYYVISRNCRLDDFFLIYVNESYLDELQIPLKNINESNVDIKRLFVKESVMSKILLMQQGIADKVRQFKRIIKSKEPMTEVGAQCDSPFECMFKHYCKHEDTTDFDIW